MDLGDLYYRQADGPDADLCFPEPRALTIAGRLRLRWGDAAIEQAHREFTRAVEIGDIARADIYHATWAALRYRDSVIFEGDPLPRVVNA